MENVCEWMSFDTALMRLPSRDVSLRNWMFMGGGGRELRFLSRDLEPHS